MTMVPNFPLPGADPLLVPALGPDAARPLRFSGDSSRFLSLLIRGACLELVTFGFYRFWLATDMRRHLWAATSVGGDAAEYTGRARELLAGFLLALAIVGPLAVVNFLLGIYAENLQAFASAPLALFYFAFTQFAMYRARRYRLTRTVWRGVRFWMTGSGWRYAWKSFWWAVLAAVTLGLAWPWRVAALERYKMANTFYGDLPGSFTGTGGALFKRVWWIWLTAIVAVFLVVAIAAAVLGARAHGSASEAKFAVAAATGFGLLALVLVALVAYPLLRASEWRWWASGIRFGGVSFASSVRRRAVIWLYAKTILLSAVVVSAIATLIVAALWVAVVVFHLKGGNFANFDLAKGFQLNSLAAMLAFVTAYLVLALAALAVQRLFLQHELWRLIIDSLMVSGLSAADDVSARGAAASAVGEGLVDGLDVAGF